MDHNASISAIAEVIQLAVAPVFLLTGIAGLLAMLSFRLGRVIDRARLLDRKIPFAEDTEQANQLQAEARMVWRRIALMNWAIRLAVGSALLISLVVVFLFLGDFATANTGGMIAILFIGAMVLFILSLLLLLIEVSISTKKMRQGLEHLLADKS